MLTIFPFRLLKWSWRVSILIKTQKKLVAPPPHGYTVDLIWKTLKYIFLLLLPGRVTDTSADLFVACRHVADIPAKSILFSRWLKDISAVLSNVLLWGNCAYLTYVNTLNSLTLYDSKLGWYVLSYLSTVERR